jgi:hypothetical protein
MKDVIANDMMIQLNADELAAIEGGGGGDTITVINDNSNGSVIYQIRDSTGSIVAMTATGQGNFYAAADVRINTALNNLGSVSLSNPGAMSMGTAANLAMGAGDYFIATMQDFGSGASSAFQSGRAAFGSAWSSFMSLFS